MINLSFNRPNKNDAYIEVYKKTALKMSEFSNSMKLYFYEHAVVELSDKYWVGQTSVNTHCSIFMTINNCAKMKCNDKLIILKPFHFYFIPSQMKVTLCEHDHATLYHTLFRMNSWSGLDLWHLLTPQVVEISSYPQDLLEDYIKTARTEMPEYAVYPNQISSEFKLFSICYQLLSLFFEVGQWALPEHNLEVIDRIEKAVNFIEKNLQNNHSITEIAKHASMSRERFTHEFKKIIGITPARYKMERRLENIQLMLLHNDLTIEELANLYGFSSAFHLSRVFKQHFGIAPKYFKQNRPLF